MCTDTTSWPFIFSKYKVGIIGHILCNSHMFYGIQGVVEIPASRRPPRKQVVHVKIIVIGPAGCGKTSFMLRYTKDDFDIFKHPSVSSCVSL